jgi:arabinose-5-phosphate isomerase
MTSDPITTHADDLVYNALETMEYQKKPVNILPVVTRDRKVEGVLRLHNIVQAGLL